jgi:competence protein ComEC
MKIRHTDRYPFLIIGIALISGIIAGRYLLPVRTVFWLVFLLSPAALFLYWRKRTPAGDMFLFLLLMLAAAGRFHLAATLIPKNHLSFYLSSQPTGVCGVVSDAIYRRNGSDNYIMCSESLTMAGKCIPVQGKFLLQSKDPGRRFKYGDRLLIKAAVRPLKGNNTPGQFDYRTYLRDRDIYALVSLSAADSVHLLSENNGSQWVQRIIVPARTYCRRTFSKNLPLASAALLQALILGEKQDLDSQMTSQFQKAGVIHVLAISGLHVGFIIAFVFSALTLLRIRRPARMIVLITVLVVYMAMIRFKTPVIRASFMAVLFMGGQLLERRTSVYNIIFASLTMILLFDPRELFQPGFQFSYMAVISIVYGYNKFITLWPPAESAPHSNPWRHYIRKWIGTPFLVSLSAVLGTLPLSLYYYGLIPVYAVLVNLIVIPLTGLIVFLSLFLLLFQPLGSVFASGLGQLITALHTVLQIVVDQFIRLPFASLLTIIPGLILIVLMYAGILVLINYTSFRPLVWLGCLALISLFIFLSLPDRQHRGVQISFIDVGQGDAAFLSFPNGKKMLIDGGDRSRYWDNGARVLLPYLQASGALHIDYMVGSHAHNDHIGGFLYLLEHLDIDTLVLSPYVYNSFLYRQVREKASLNGVFLKTVRRGDQLWPDRNCRVYILHPDSQFAAVKNLSGKACNNSSLVIKIQYGENAVLFTGDLEKEAERPVLSYGDFLESEVLKVGHHGSLTSTSDSFLQQVDPIAAIISVGEKNRFKHPSSWTLYRLRKHGSKPLLTSKQGTINLLIEPDKITRLY